MQTSEECIPCLVRQVAEAVGFGAASPPAREQILREGLRMLAEADWAASPPRLAGDLHRLIRELADDPDPYRRLKQRMNARAMEMLAVCREMIARAADPDEAALRIAVAGNLLDAGAKVQAMPDDLPQLMAGLWSKPWSGEPRELLRAAEQAGSILYLADNAGEIVFDRLLIERLPRGKVTVAVRGSPVLNDALREDAELAGIPAVAKVIPNGSDIPGTLPDECSAEFRRHFDAADLILSKGQGNYETLCATPAPIYFLFTVKCARVAAQIGEPAGTMVARRSPAWKGRGAP